MSTFDKMWDRLSDREYRAEFAAAQFKRLVPFQIRALRKNRGWTQEQLAQNSKLTQGVISRAEDSDNGNLTANTILRIADGFDVAFVGRFVPYSELDEWFTKLSENAVRVPSFDDEERFLKSGLQVFPRKLSRRRRTRVQEPAKRVVYIDTWRQAQPQTAARKNQLSLPLSSSGLGAGLTIVDMPAKTLGGPAMTNLIQNAPPKSVQIAGGL